MRIIECEQGSMEWLQARLGIPTASEMNNLFTPLYKEKEGKSVDTYLCKKLAERWRGEPLVSFSGGSLEQGSLREDEATPFYEFKMGVEIRHVGFITTDDGRIGCSPDGLLGEDGGIEIKCPEPHTHVGYLLAGELPKDYVIQVQGCMLVTGRPWWKFMSYCRGLPPLILTVPRDNAAIAKMEPILDNFCIRLDEAFKKLVDLNGGPPPPPPIITVDDDGTVTKTLDRSVPQSETLSKKMMAEFLDAKPEELEAFLNDTK